MKRCGKYVFIEGINDQRIVSYSYACERPACIMAGGLRIWYSYGKLFTVAKFQTMF
ncbi:hypothetical protein HMPREF9554_00399 [Treponema phagedenis F0421]|nr:hypothetical protein HMPREF9554_00399 [Treponema phagedenis F0421]